MVPTADIVARRRCRRLRGSALEAPELSEPWRGAAALSRAVFALLQEQNPRIGREQGCVGTGYSLAVITTELKPTAVPVIGDAGCGAG